MYKRLILKVFSVMLSVTFVLMLYPLTVGATEIVSAEDGTLNDFSSNAQQKSALDYVSWGSNVSGNMASSYVLIGQTRSLTRMGLSPEAYSDGVCSREFTWYSASPTVATIDPSTGAVTGIAAGTAIITGTSSFGSAIGQLTLVVFVADSLKGGTFLSVPGYYGEDCNGEHSSKYYVVNEFFLSMGYTPYVLRSSATSSLFAAYVATSRMFCFRNHGTKTSLILNNTDITRAYADFIYTLPTKAFAYCELAVIASEYSGRGGAGATNVVNALQSRGVGTVVGITSDVSCEELDHWIEGVFFYLNEGYTVQDACEMTAMDFKDIDIYVWGGQYEHNCTNDCTERCTGYHLENYYIAGNANATFN